MRGWMGRRVVGCRNERLDGGKIGWLGVMRVDGEVRGWMRG